MLTTGREVDRLLIAIMMIVVLILACYTYSTKVAITNRAKIDEAGLSERINYLNDQLHQTKQELTEWVSRPAPEVVENEEDTTATEEKDLPVPVSSSFLG